MAMDGAEMMLGGIFNPPSKDPNRKPESELRDMLSRGRVQIMKRRTAYTRNRQYLGGNQDAIIRNGRVYTDTTRTNPTRNQRQRINLLKRYVTARTALLASGKPPSEVATTTSTTSAQAAVRTAERIISHEWGNTNGINIERVLREAVRYAETDGVSWLNVYYDPSVEPYLGATPITQAGPVTDPDGAEALHLMDPDARALWQPGPQPRGAVRARAVRCSSISCDPNMQTDPSQCRWVIETRVRDIDELSEALGIDVDKIVNKRGGTKADVDYATGQLNYHNATTVRVHELVCVPLGEGSRWPNGAHIVWVDGRESEPLLAEPWIDIETNTPRPLPWRLVALNPTGEHILETEGLTDDLVPMQDLYNQIVERQLRWFDLVSWPPIITTGGGIRSGSVFGPKREIKVNPGPTPPFFMNIPADPGASADRMLMKIEALMAEIAVMSPATRGQAPNNRDWSQVSLDSLIAQDEKQIGQIQDNYRSSVEWLVNMILHYIARYYGGPMNLGIPGAEDIPGLKQFFGRQLNGGLTWRVTGSMMPKSRQQQFMQLLQLAQLSGGRFDLTQYASQVIEGDVDDIVSRARGDKLRAQAENQMMYEYGSHPEADMIWQSFIEMRDQYAQTMQMATELARINPEQGAMLMAQLQMVPPPRVLDLLARSGIPTPKVEPTDMTAAHVAEIKAARDDTSYNGLHPLVQQALREHEQDHVGREAANVAAMASQSPMMLAGKPGAQPPQQAELGAPQ